MTYAHGADNLSAIERELSGKRLGLITNPSGMDTHLRPTIDLLRERFSLVRLYAPEHGIRGEKQEGAAVTDYVDEESGIYVQSLFEGNREIDLDGIDGMVYDIQDVGLRFYSYPYTMAGAMRKCAEAGIPFFVLDRYDPLGLSRVGGAVIEEECDSVVGGFGLPSRYGLTIGELARYINKEYGIGCELYVAPCLGLSRSTDWRNAGVPFILPSPNLPSVDSLLCYVGNVLLEGTNLSEGRGTTTPFQVFGAPWLDAKWLCEKLSDTEGAMLQSVFFKPMYSKFSGELCRGVRIHVTDPDTFDAFRFTLRMIGLVKEHHEELSIPGAETIGPFDYLLGTKEARRKDFDLDEFLARQEKKRTAFLEKSAPHRLYF